MIFNDFDILNNILIYKIHRNGNFDWYTDLGCWRKFKLQQNQLMPCSCFLIKIVPCCDSIFKIFIYTLLNLSKLFKQVYFQVVEFQFPSSLIFWIKKEKFFLYSFCWRQCEVWRGIEQDKEEQQMQSSLKRKA